jgi:hypothetical protein
MARHISDAIARRQVTTGFNGHTAVDPLSDHPSDTALPDWLKTTVSGATLNER